MLNNIKKWILGVIHEAEPLAGTSQEFIAEMQSEMIRLTFVNTLIKLRVRFGSNN